MVREKPTEACQFFYDCRGCGEVLRPLAGDCCVFCIYGYTPCPPIQQGCCCNGGDALTAYNPFADEPKSDRAPKTHQSSQGKRAPLALTHHVREIADSSVTFPRQSL